MLFDSFFKRLNYTLHYKNAVTSDNFTTFVVINGVSFTNIIIIRYYTKQKQSWVIFDAISQSEVNNSCIKTLWVSSKHYKHVNV